MGPQAAPNPPAPRLSLRARSAIAIAAIAGTLLAARSGEAGDLHVLLIGPSATHPTVVRVRQELTLLGLDVEVVTSGAKMDLATAAREHEASAVARVEETPPEIVLWVDAAHSAGTTQESRVSDSLAGRTEPGLLALRAVELLRGRLLPVPIVPTATAAPGAAAPATTEPALPTTSPSATASVAPGAPPKGTATAPPEGSTGPHVAPPRPSRGSIHVGPAIVASPGGVPVAPMLRLGGGWRVLARLELDGFAMIPLAGSTVSQREGQIELRVLAVGAGASVHFTRPESALALHAGGGFGVATFFYEGRATAPWISASGTQATAMPFLEIGGGYRVTPVIGLRADLLSALTRPSPVLVFAGREVASFGSPFVLASIALEIHP